ncbi:MAG TPA: efflux RND transporter periplasmic adaptor subunit [Polyangiaceae bacterium]|nr:efflux RND transporter periplasmic adaptor subunit [Polyangiaceae bacterium]
MPVPPLPSSASPTLDTLAISAPRRAAGPLGRLSLVLLLATTSVAALSLEACREQEGKAAAATGAPGGPPGAAGPAGAPPSVTVISVKPETLPVVSEWIATLDGYVNAQIRPQVTGYLIQRTYEEGAAVKKDQVLFEIDPRPFRTAMAQAEATLARAQADLGRAERDKARDTPLAKERAIPQSQLDNDVQSELAARAAVKAAEAAIDAAKLNLSFTKVRSLIDGVAAIATAQIGDLVNPSTLLTTVSQVDPIRTYFSISEQEYLRNAQQLNQAKKQELWQSGAGLKLFLADGSEYDKPGSFLAADRQIDPRTGTIRISATFPNPERILRPGMYGRVRAETSVVEGALLVPQRAVSEMQGAAQVRVVSADNKVSLRNVTLGPRSGGRWVIESGIAAGEQVIVDGPQLRDGALVTPTPLAPSAQNNSKESSTADARPNSAASAGNTPPPAVTTATAGAASAQKPAPRGE